MLPYVESLFYFSSGPVQNKTKVKFLYADTDEDFTDDQKKGIIHPLDEITLYPNKTVYDITIVADTTGILVVAINTTGADIIP